MEKTMEQNLKNESCDCCKPWCSCGDCTRCNADGNKSCCGTNCSSNVWCSCCGTFKRYCWTCKIGKLLFSLLLILALVKLAFGGLWMGMRWHKGMMWCGWCGWWDNGSGGCMMMKDGNGERKGWFNRFEKNNDDKDDTIVSGNVAQ